MVGNLEKELIEMLQFYINLPDQIDDERDQFYADLGKSSAQKMLEIITKYNADPKNKYLKQMHAQLMTLTRGVENFHNESIEKRHRAYGKLRYRIYQTLEEKINGDA